MARPMRHLISTPRTNASSNSAPVTRRSSQSPNSAAATDAVGWMTVATCVSQKSSTLAAAALRNAALNASVRSRRPITVAWPCPENSWSDLRAISTGALRQPASATAKKFNKARFACWRAAAGTSSQRASTAKRARIGVTAGACSMGHHAFRPAPFGGVQWRGKLFRRLPQTQLPQRAVDPQARELFLHAVLVEPGPQIVEIDAVEILVLIEAGEHHALDATGGIAMHLQALRADFLHHALHRRIDRGNRLVSGLEMLREHALPRARDRRHHSVGPDRDHPIDLAERDRRLAERARAVPVERRDDVADEGLVLRALGAKARR